MLMPDVLVLQTGPAAMRDDGGAGPQRNRGNGAGFHVRALSLVSSILTSLVMLSFSCARSRTRDDLSVKQFISSPDSPRPLVFVHSPILSPLH